MASDGKLREGLRESLGAWADKLNCNGDVEKQWFYKNKFINKLRHSEIAIETDKANEQHYEVPTEFFLTVLGKRLKYSGSYWPECTTTLEQAEDESLKLICERAKVEDGQTVLDLGCGWGSLTLWLLEKYDNINVVSVSNSQTQRMHIEAQVAKAGYSDRSECITADVNFFTTDKTFDRIISIEMFEHMKNYERLFAKVSQWLKPEGFLFTQILCHRMFPYPFDAAKGSDTEWMAKHFFTGGTMPSSDLFLYFQNDVCLVDQWLINGKHYSKTLEAWLVKTDENKDKVTEIMKQTYGQPEANKQVFNWRLFFLFCSEAFAHSDGNEWIMAHHLFRKRQPNNH